MCVRLFICGCGGIGRLGGFRFLWLSRAGSSPVIRTIKRGRKRYPRKKPWYSRAFCWCARRVHILTGERPESARQWEGLVKGKGVRCEAESERSRIVGAQSVGSQEVKEQDGVDLMERILSKENLNKRQPCGVGTSG